MRRAFGVLESILALSLFSLVILLCSQTLLQVQKDLKFYRDDAHARQILSNASSYIQKKLAYGFVTSVQAAQIELYEISHEFFLDSYHPQLEKCGENKILWNQNPKFLANFSPMLEMIAVLERQGDFLLLEKGLKCGAVIPVSKKIRISLQGNGDLSVNGEILAQSIRLFEFQVREKFYFLKICSKLCETAIFPKSEIFYAF